MRKVLTREGRDVFIRYKTNAGSARHCVES